MTLDQSELSILNGTSLYQLLVTSYSSHVFCNQRSCGRRIHFRICTTQLSRGHYLDPPFQEPRSKLSRQETHGI